MASTRNRAIATWGLAMLGAVCTAAFAWSLFRREMLLSRHGLQLTLIRGQLSLGWNEGVDDLSGSWDSMRISGPPRWLVVTTDWGWSFGIIGGYDSRALPGPRSWWIGVMLWPGVLAGWGGAGLLWHLGRRGARRRKAGLCPSCGYKLTGLGPGMSCPECGHTPPPATDPPSAPR